MIRVRTETLGPDHFDTLVPLGGLAQALESMGRYDEIVLFEGMYASQLRQQDVLNPMMMFNVTRATARIEMFSGRLDRLEGRWVGSADSRKNRCAERPHSGAAARPEVARS